MKNSFFMVALFSFSIVAHAGSEIQLRELSVNDVEAKRLGTTEILVKSSRLPIDRKQNVHKIFAALSGTYTLAQGQNKFCQEFKIDDLTNKDEITNRLKEIKGYVRGEKLYASSNAVNLGDAPESLVSENAINLDLVKHKTFGRDEKISCLFERQKISLELALNYKDYMGSDGSGGIAISTLDSQASNDVAAVEAEINVPMTFFIWPPHPPRAVCKPANEGEKCGINLEKGSKQIFNLTF